MTEIEIVFAQPKIPRLQGRASGRVGYGAQAAHAPRCRAFSGHGMRWYRVEGCAAPDAF